MAFGLPKSPLSSKQPAASPFGAYKNGIAQPEGNWRKASPGQAQPQQSPWATSTPYNQAQQLSDWNPNIANNPQANRPPAFQSQSFNFDGTQSQMPDYARRDAMISQINNQIGQMQSQSWNQQMGAPQFNFGQMWDQAGNMVQQGWQNPMAPQDSAAAIRGLVQGPSWAQMPEGPSNRMPPGQYGFAGQFANRDAWQQKLEAGAQKYMEQLAPGDKPRFEQHLAKFQDDFQRLLGHYQESDLPEVWKRARQNKLGPQSEEIDRLLTDANTYGAIDPAIVRNVGAWARSHEQESSLQARRIDQQNAAAWQRTQDARKKEGKSQEQLWNESNDRWRQEQRSQKLKRERDAVKQARTNASLASQQQAQEAGFRAWQQMQAAQALGPARPLGYAS